GGAVREVNLAGADGQRAEADAGGEEAGVLPRRAGDDGPDNHADAQHDPGQEEVGENTLLHEDAGLVLRLRRHAEPAAGTNEQHAGDYGGGDIHNPVAVAEHGSGIRSFILWHELYQLFEQVPELLLNIAAMAMIKAARVSQSLRRCQHPLIA